MGANLKNGKKRINSADSHQDEFYRPKESLQDYFTDVQISDFNKGEIEKLEHLLTTMENKEFKISVMNSCLETKKYFSEEIDNYISLMEKAEYEVTKDSLAMNVIQIINSPLDKGEKQGFFLSMYTYINDINKIVRIKKKKGDKNRYVRKLCSILRQRPGEFVEYLTRCLEKT